MLKLNKIFNNKENKKNFMKAVIMKNNHKFQFWKK